ncbi:MAG TPA: hypothetical protein VN036_00580 [Devosia sp.]|nr:hypothetical protein [Devosia sp.]
MNRLYSIHLRGFDSVVVEAKSAGAARYKLFKQWRDAGWDPGYRRAPTPFGYFLQRVECTLHLGAVR